MSSTLMCHILSCSLTHQNSVSQISVWSILVFIIHKINPCMLMSFVSHSISKAGPLRTALYPKCETHYHCPICPSGTSMLHTKAFFWLGLRLILCMRRVPRTPPSVAACCPGQQMPRARPGDFDSSIHSCALEHLPDIMGFCIPWCNISCYFKCHSVTDGMNADCFTGEDSSQ